MAPSPVARERSHPRDVRGADHGYAERKADDSPPDGSPPRFHCSNTSFVLDTIAFLFLHTERHALFSTRWQDACSQCSHVGWLLFVWLLWQVGGWCTCAGGSQGGVNKAEIRCEYTLNLGIFCVEDLRMTFWDRLHISLKRTPHLRKMAVLAAWSRSAGHRARHLTDDLG